MLKRTLTGAVILLFTIGFIALKCVSDYFFDAFVLIISYVSLYEILKSYKISGKKVCELPLYCVPILMVAIWEIDKTVTRTWIYFALVVLVVLIYSLTEDIILMAKARKDGSLEKSTALLNQSLFENTKNAMMVLAYPLLPLMFLLALNQLSYNLSYMGIILSFAVAMCTDTMAFLIGKAFGKRKFVPEVSPNKTIAGLIGGFLGGMIAVTCCFVTFYYLPAWGFNELSLKATIPVFVSIAIFGSYLNTLGDLIASAFKRKAGIKDFSNIFPGHGGFMDRVDGLIFTSILIYVIFVLFLV